MKNRKSGNQALRARSELRPRARDSNFEQNQFGASALRESVGIPDFRNYNHNMEHTTVPEPPGFRDLPKKQQVRYVQALWDSIADNDDSIPVLEFQLRVAEDRLRALQRNPELAVCARQMLEDIAKASS